jgi:hypothetical protein
MSRKPHPADIANAAIVAAAVRFDIALFLGAGRYATGTAATLDEARDVAGHMEAMHRNGRRPLIYGVTADGRSGLVTDNLFNPSTKVPDMIKRSPIKAKKAKAKKAKPAAKTKTKAPSKIVAKANGRPLGKRAAVEAAAREGKLPSPPDFSAETHKRFRNKLEAVVELAKSGNISGLRKFEINPIGSSPKAIARYRDLCLMALEAKG